MLKIQPKNIITVTVFLFSSLIILQVDKFFYTLGLSPVRPWLFILFTFILTIFALPLSKNIAHKYDNFGKEYKFLFFAYLLYVGVHITEVLSPPPNFEHIGAYGRTIYTALIVIFGIIIGLLNNIKLYLLFRIILYIHVGLLFFDLFIFQISYSTSWGRAAGTLENPNIASFTLVALMISSLKWNPCKFEFWDFAVVIVSGIGIILCVSILGNITFLVAILGYGIYWIMDSRRSNIPIKKIFCIATICAMYAILVTSIVIYKKFSGVITYEYATSQSKTGSSKIFDNNESEIAETELYDSQFFKNNALLQQRQNLGFNERLIAMEDSIELIKEAPIIGNGFGYTYTMDPGPHNMFLRALLDGGSFGLIGLLIVFIALARIGFTCRDKSLIILVLVLFTIAMANHNLTEERSLLFIIGLLLSASTISSNTSPHKF